MLVPPREFYNPSTCVPLRSGVRLGPYEILTPLGAGGMGEVYRARDTKLDRDVAVKVLPPQLAENPTALARFEREAKAVAALSHPNILAIFDFGREQGTAYAVTELLDGETLRQKLAPLVSARKAVDYAVQIARGLAAAHAKGIVHRDLKPENVFVTTDGRVKILDFGLARQTLPYTGADATTSPTIDRQTDPGTVLGTVGYMSPEQVRGEAGDHRSDLFSFGAVLYELVSGRRAFQRDTAAETMTAILREEPADLVAASTGGVPSGLARVIQHCLEKSPAERFQSASDVAFALEPLAESAKSSPHALSRSVRAVAAPEPLERTLARTGRARWLIPAATLALILLATGAYLYQSRQPIESLAVLPFVNASGNDEADYLSDGLTESLIDSLSQVPSLKVMSRNAVFRYKGKDTDARDAAKQLGVRAVLTGRIVQRGSQLSVRAELIDARDNSELWGEQYDRKLADVLAVQQDIASRISQKLRLRLSGEQKQRVAKRGTQNPEAYQLYLKGRFFAGKFTKEGFDKGLDYLRQAIAVDPSYALAFEGVSYAYQVADEIFLPPNEAMPRAKEAARKVIELDDSLAEGHAALGAVQFWYDYDWQGAEREFKRAIELNPNFSFAHEVYGWSLVSLGRLQGGIAESRRAQELDPLSSEASALLGQSLYLARRFDEAADVCRKTIDLDPDYLISRLILSQVYRQQGRYKEAIALLTKADQISPGVDWVAESLAAGHAAGGNRTEAKRLLNELTERAKQGYVPAYYLAVIYVALGDKDDALAALEKDYEQRGFWMTNLKVDPLLDSLRGEPRFKQLLRRMNLPP